MAKAAGFVKKDTTEKRTCIGGNHGMIKTSSMNKHKRRGYKRYRGQGRKQMTYCLNCGHESHCGVEYRKDAHNGRGEFLGQMVVCKHCRCELCDDRNEPWPGPGVQEKKMAGMDCVNEECKNPLCDCDPCYCTEDDPCTCCLVWDGE